MAVPIVIHVVVSLAPGGLERLVVDWTNARNNSAPGSTSVCCLDEVGELGSFVHGGCVTELGSHRGLFPFDVSAVWQLASLLRRIKREGTEPSAVVVHSHNLSAWQYAAMAARLARVSHVHTEHGTNPHYRGAVNRLRNVCLARTTDVIVAVAFNTAEELVRNQGIRRSRIRVIRNGVADAGVCGGDAALVRQRYGLLADTPVIGSVGRLAKVKGQDRLIRAFAVLRETTDCRLLLVGGGPDQPELEELVVRLGVGDSVFLVGHQNCVRDYLAAMDIFVLPSRSEGLPVALLEAMLAGVPVAATHVGEVAEILDHGRAGRVMPDDESQWAPLLGDMLEDSATAIAADVSRYARRRVKDEYSQAVTLKEYEHVYCDAAPMRIGE